MKWTAVSDVSFTDVNGKNHLVKDIKPIDPQTIALTTTIDKNTFIDELISRKAIYGEDTESLLQNVVEANATALIEAEFDLTNIKTLLIPKIEA